MNTQGQKTILLVEDEAITTLVTAVMLKRFGYAVITANSGEQSVQIAATDPTIDLVLMDIGLGGGMNGIEAARQILGCRTIPIIFHTIHSKQETIDYTRGIECYGYVIKKSGSFVLQSSIEMAFELFKAHTNMRESEARFRAMVEWTPDAVVVHRHGKILYVNPAAVSLFGAASAQDLVGGPILDRIHPDFHQIALTLQKKTFDNGGEAPLIEMKYLQLDGTVADAEFLATQLVYDGGPAVYVSVRNITERKRTEAALMREQYRLQGTIAGTNAGTWEWNVQTGETVFNERWAKIIGYTLEELAPVSIKTWERFVHPADLLQCNDKLERYFQGEFEDYQCESRMRHKNGEWVWVVDRGKVASRSADGKPLVMFGTHQDVTGRKRAEEKYRQLSQAVEQSPVSIVITDTAGSIEYVNPKFVEVTGYCLDEVAGKNPRVLKSGYSSPEEYSELWRTLTTGGEWRGEFHNKKKNGDLYWESATISPIVNADGETTHFLAVKEDITARKQVDTMLRESELRYAQLAKQNRTITWEVDAEGLYTYVSPVAEAVIGYRSAELVGCMHFYDLHPEEGRELFKTAAHAVFDRKESFLNMVTAIQTKDGGRVWVSTNGIPLLNSDGIFCGYHGTDTDITNRKQSTDLSEARNRISEFSETHTFDEVLQASLDETERLTGSRIGFYHFLEEDQKTLTLQMWSTNSLENMCKAEGKGQHYDVDHAGVWAECVSTRTPVIHNDYASLPNRKGMPEGHATIVRELVVPVLKGNHVVAILGVGNKITDYTQHDAEIVSTLAENSWDIVMRKRVEEKLSKSEKQFRFLVQSSHDIIYTITAEGIFTFVSDAWTLLLGHPIHSVVGRSFQQFIHPDDLPLCMEFLKRQVEYGNSQPVVEYRVQHINGSWRWHATSAVSLADEKGMFITFEGIARDITERKHAEEKLMQAEKRLLRSEKMEAIGLLAGGIAHDFNNILTGIIGYTGMSERHADNNPVLKNNLLKVLAASDRAQKLVQQILSFSRQSVQQKEIIELSPIVLEVIDLLKASVPSSVEIRADLQTGVRPVFADSTKLHEVILNLATNAVHAMNQNGTLTFRLYSKNFHTVEYVRTGELAPGEYSVIDVVDTGIGMDSFTLAKAFEPFFTTKAFGIGTGMGLSVVLGIVQQHGGNIHIESVKGEGATFQMYLPVFDGFDAGADGIQQKKQCFGTERILFVDDEQMILEMAEAEFTYLGYTVTCLSNGRDALEFMKKNAHAIDILITDQTMPGLTGIELAKEALLLQKNLLVILCTGFSNMANPELAKSAGIHEFVTKPYEINNISRLIHSMVEKMKDVR